MRGVLLLINDALFSSNRDDWETPKDLFNSLNDEFHFTLDAASSDENALCVKHYTLKEDGLSQSWMGETVYCNPPYGRDVGKWLAKASDETKNGVTTVMLLPARTDTKAFHEYVYGKAEIRFIKGRVKYTLGGAESYPAPFPSMIVIFRPEAE